MGEFVRKSLTRKGSKSSASLASVAARAEVSTATVSRVLNGAPNVSSAVRQRVEQAFEELGYVPNGAARALAARRSMAVGAIVPTIENGGFAAAIGAFQRVLSANGYTLLLTCSNYDAETELREARNLLSRGVDGMLLVGSEHQEALVELLGRYSVPVVETWTLAPGRSSVGFDNAAAAAALAEHLAGLGHRRIGVITGRLAGNDRAHHRVQGIRDFLSRHGLPPAQEWGTERPYRIEEGRRAVAELAADGRLPTALICGNDQLAFGALIEAGARGLAVPADISIAGFNDQEFAAHLTPPLTTIRIPAEEIGRRSAELLLQRIADPRRAGEALKLGFELVRRQSTGAPPCR
ncbi:MAG: substrate-binding domain-containing protein [Rhizobiaceae bacterium]|nr:substrate-binding domain-containing protein [Rhizobiaceae bacterium]